MRPAAQFLGHNHRAVSAIFWTTDVNGPQTLRCDLRVNEYTPFCNGPGVRQRNPADVKALHCAEFQAPWGGGFFQPRPRRERPRRRAAEKRGSASAPELARASTAPIRSDYATVISGEIDMELDGTSDYPPRPHWP